MTDSIEFIPYTAQAGDRWDTLANRFYGDPNRITPLVRLNPEIGFVRVIPEGLVVRIPILEEADQTTTSALPPWRA